MYVKEGTREIMQKEHMVCNIYAVSHLHKATK